MPLRVRSGAAETEPPEQRCHQEADSEICANGDRRQALCERQRIGQRSTQVADEHGPRDKSQRVPVGEPQCERAERRKPEFRAAEQPGNEVRLRCSTMPTVAGIAAGKSRSTTPAASVATALTTRRMRNARDMVA